MLCHISRPSQASLAYGIVLAIDDCVNQKSLIHNAALSDTIYWSRHLHVGTLTIDRRSTEK